MQTLPTWAVRSWGDQLDRVRKLRNRVAHHENLLSVDIRRRLRDMLGVLALIDPNLPDLAMQSIVSARLFGRILAARGKRSRGG